MKRALFVLCVLLAAGCGGDDDHTNQPPTVTILTRPQGERLSYAVDISWSGTDPDGVIDHYEYTIDVPDDVTIDELNDPNFTGVEWTATDATGAMFLFSTPHPETLDTGGSIVITDVYVGDHNLFVRSVDNEGARSPVDYIEFTAENVKPQTDVSLGPGGCSTDFESIILVPPVIEFEADGLDPDRPGSDKGVALFEWKVIPVDAIFVVDDVNYWINVDPGPSYPWLPLSADSDSSRVVVHLETGKDAILAVRAVDVHGAVESRFDEGRNVALLGVHPGDRLAPTVYVREENLGTIQPPGATTEVPVGLDLEFDIQALAPEYGRPIDGYCLRIDPADLEAPCDWTTSPVASVRFDNPGAHTLVFQARDCMGSVGSLTLLLQAVALPFDRDVLYVDDHRQFRSLGVLDADMDAMALAMIEEGGPFAEVYRIDPWGTADVNLNPEPVPLSVLARYRQVVWSVSSTAYAANSELVRAAECGSKSLRMYLAAGGAAWIYGQRVFGSFQKFGPPSASCLARLDYEETRPLEFAAGSFVGDFLGMPGASIRSAVQNRINGLVRARPSAGFSGGEVPFPAVEIDSTLFSQVEQVQGIPFVDVNFAPVHAAGLDTIYVVDKTPSASSVFRNRPIAWAYADPDPVPDQGPLAVFGFPVHVLKQGSAAEGTGVQGMAKAMFAWFRSHGVGI